MLAVVNAPHPPPAPTVTITDNRVETDANRRIPGNLDRTVQKSLIGGQVFLKANGNSEGKYHWDSTGPVDERQGIDSNTVAFTTKDDGSVPPKDVYTMTAKVTFTNNAGVKAEATVTINVHVPTLPEYTGTPSASNVEMEAFSSRGSI